MKAGDTVYTPRFCTVIIKEVFENKEEAFANGYTEPTYYDSDEYDVRGNSIDMYHMQFAAFKKEKGGQ